MKKGVSVAISWLIIIVVATGLTLIMLFAVFWPVLLEMLFGSCHSSAWSQTRELKNDMQGKLSASSGPLEFDLQLGGCVRGIVFVNGYKDPDYGSIIREKCNLRYEKNIAFMLVIPTTGDKYICREFQHQFSTTGISSIPAGYPDKTNKDDHRYCIEVRPVEIAGSSGDYTYRISEEPCLIVDPDLDDPD